MSRPLAADGITVSDGSWQIFDAQAFHIGKSETVHALGSFPHSATVTGRCGVTGSTAGDDDSSRPAIWAAGEITCKTCLQRSN